MWFATLQKCIKEWNRMKETISYSLEVRLAGIKCSSGVSHSTCRMRVFLSNLHLSSSHPSRRFSLRSFRLSWQNVSDLHGSCNSKNQFSSSCGTWIQKRNITMPYVICDIAYVLTVRHGLL